MCTAECKRYSFLAERTDLATISSRDRHRTYSIGSRGCRDTPASFKRPLISRRVYMWLSVCSHVCLQLLMLNIPETKRFTGSSCSMREPIGKCLQCVDWWRHWWRHVTMTSWSRRHNLQSRCVRKLLSGSTIRVDVLSAHYRRTSCLIKKSGHSAKKSGRKSIWRNPDPTENCDLLNYKQSSYQPISDSAILLQPIRSIVDALRT